jgi:hypothetical protein
MIHSVVPGLIAFRMLSGRASGVLGAVLNMLLLYKLAAFAAAERGINLRLSFEMLRSFLL